MDEEAAKLARARRFGLEVPELEEEKKKARAKRFGTDHPELLAEKMKERAKRFGTTPMDDKDRMSQRALRFGLNNPGGAVKRSLADAPLKAK